MATSILGVLSHMLTGLLWRMPTALQRSPGGREWGRPPTNSQGDVKFQSNSPRGGEFGQWPPEWAWKQSLHPRDQIDRQPWPVLSDCNLMIELVPQAPAVLYPDFWPTETDNNKYWLYTGRFWSFLHKKIKNINVQWTMHSFILDIAGIRWPSLRSQENSAQAVLILEKLYFILEKEKDAISEIGKAY